MWVCRAPRPRWTSRSCPSASGTQDYKETLEAMIKPEEKDGQQLLTDYNEYHTGNTVHFQLFMTPERVQQVEVSQQSRRGHHAVG